jgi:pyrroline-5-carboxylate reductase
MKLGFIGCGKMAGALIRGILGARVCAPTDICVSDVTTTAVSALAEETGVVSKPSNAGVAAASETVVLCVKPQDSLTVLRSIQPSLEGRLLISIAAGWNLARLEEASGSNVRVVRVMPNTPSLVHRGASAYSLGTAATAQDAQTVESIFGAVGIVGQVQESLLDVVTGLSGSGPAYGFLMVEALADGGVLMGLPRELALRLAAQTLAGAAEMVLQTGSHPGSLRDAVASPGGTTIAGIEALERGGVRAGLIAAVRAATERSREMGR